MGIEKCYEREVLYLYRIQEAPHSLIQNRGYLLESRILKRGVDESVQSEQFLDYSVYNVQKFQDGVHE